MAFSAKTGIDMAFAAIFILGIGLTVTEDTVNASTSTGTAATVVGYGPLIVAAGFLYTVARLAGIL